MANPLQILGGLATVGAGGAQGALTGIGEGEELRRKHVTEDEQNRIRALQAIQMGQSQMPHEKIQGGRRYVFDPRTGSMTDIGPAEQAPLNAVQQQTIATSQQNMATSKANEERYRLQSDRLKNPPSVEAKTLGEKYVRAFADGNTDEMARILEAMKTEHAAKSGSGAAPTFDALVAASKNPNLTEQEREAARVASEAINQAHIKRAKESRAEPTDKPLGKDAAKWANAQGQLASPLDTPTQATNKGFKPFQGKVPPEVSSKITLAAIDQALAMVPTLEAKGLLMSRPGLMPFLWTESQRHGFQRGDPDLTAFVSHTSTLVRTARELGDIGFRAKQAIEGTLNLVEKSQTAGGVEKALHQLRNLVSIAAPSTVERRLRVFNTRTGKYQTAIFEAGETLEQLPEYLDPNR